MQHEHPQKREAAILMLQEVRRLCVSPNCCEFLPGVAFRASTSARAPVPPPPSRPPPTATPPSSTLTSRTDVRRFGWVWQEICTWVESCERCRQSVSQCQQHNLCFDTSDGIVKLLAGDVGRHSDLKVWDEEDAIREIFGGAEGHVLVNVQGKHHQFVVEQGFDALVEAEAAPGHPRGRVRVFQSWSGYFNLAWWLCLSEPLRWHMDTYHHADLRFQKFRDRQLECGALTPDEGVQLLRFLIRKGGPVWRIEHHILRGATGTAAGTGKRLDAHWAESLALLGQLTESRASTDELQQVADSLSRELLRSGEHQRAVILARVVDKLGLPKSSYSLALSNAIEACEHMGTWAEALQLMQTAQQRGCPAEVRHYCLAIGACERAGNISMGKALLKEAGQKGFDVDVLSYSAIMIACERGGDFRHGLAEIYGDTYKLMIRLCNDPKLCEQLHKQIHGGVHIKAKD
eukprot:gnl/TRDRNA2_/TRDRNA2_136271_c1_seq1.p1 gnl/TRDRNA2_/TRDRNA2_136271_c1~~gnl/TRDRNA2_/TRDRNA2_136271_c1_seq1.p1  ORF type:complete len:460 (+),score=70.44 gnl/TRDRNA2_/TRDRNA2_136271_c1_seq1:105-1484(+)